MANIFAPGGAELAKKSDLPPQWNILSGTKDLSSFYFKNGGSIEKKSNFSSNPNIGLVQTDMIAHLWGAAPNVGMLWNRDNPYFNKGYYTLSLIARHSDTSTPNLTFPLQCFSDYTDARKGVPVVTFNITGTFQKYSSTFYIDTAGNYSNWRLGNADNVPYPYGSIYIADIKLEPGTVATPWIPSSNDIVMQSDVASLQDKINNLFSAKYSPLIDNTSDLNTVPLGFVRSFGSKPQNAPNGLQPWAIYLTIAMDETENTLIQLGIDSNGNIFGRTKGGSPAKWNEWFAISQR